MERLMVSSSQQNNISFRRNLHDLAYKGFGETILRFQFLRVMVAQPWTERNRR
jgi:hypothetical protein